MQTKLLVFEGGSQISGGLEQGLSRVDFSWNNNLTSEELVEEKTLAPKNVESYT